MANPRTNKIAELEERKQILESRLNAIELQLAQLGIYAPSHIAVEKEQLQHELSDLSARLEELRSAAADGREPYRGLHAYGEQDVAFFQGRGGLVQQLIDKLAQHAFLAALGPSGSGKSSLVRAGIVPKLRSGALDGSQNWRYLTLQPGRYPLTMLAQKILDMPGSERLHTSHAEQLALFRNGDDELLKLAYRLSDDSSIRLALVVDQFEELWTQARESPDQEREPFIRQLVTAAEANDGRMLIILTLRDDFFAEVGKNRNLARLVDSHFMRVDPPTAAELEQIVLRPAELVGCRFDPGLAEELVRQVVDRPGALPLLQYTLQQLWIERTGPTLTWAAFNKIGQGAGVAGALAATANKIFDGSKAPDALRALLVRLVLPGDDTASARRGVPLADLVSAGGLDADVRTLIEPLVKAGLLTTGVRTDAHQQRQEIVELTHETLIHAWPRFQSWINDDRANLRFQFRLEEAAREWAESQGDLWSGSLLVRAEDWRNSAKPQLNEREQRFLDASQSAQRARVEMQQAAEAERRVARQTRQIVGSAIGAGLGYCCGLLYATLSASAGPLLLGRWNVSWFTLVFLALVLLATGSMVGVCLAVGLGYTSRRHWQALTTMSVGAVAGSIIYLLLALYFLAGQNGALPYVLPGALLGVGLGAGLSAVDVPLRICAISWRWQRIGATALGGTLAAGAAYATGYFARDIVSALVSGMILGGFTGAGFAFGGPARGDEEHQ